MIGLLWALFPLFFVQPVPAPSHPMYVSVSQVDHNADDKTLEITIKVFTDDLEEALLSHSGKNLGLGYENESTEADETISAYLQEKITLQVNGKAIPFNLLGKEVEMQVTWLYVRQKTSTKLRRLP